MSHFLKLLNLEIRRFRYVLLALMVFTLAVQAAALVYRVNDQLRRYRDHEETVRSAFFPSGKLSFDWLIFSTQLEYFIPIAVSMAVIGAYALVIWYRDWFGRHTFAYRLLMLPDGRTAIYFAKLAAILLFVLSMLSWQLLILPIERLLFDAIVPADLRVDAYFTDIMLAGRAFEFVLPLPFEQFLFLYGIGVLAVVILFTSLLLERSYRRWGILYGIVYATLNVVLLVYPIFSTFNIAGYRLYPDEVGIIWLGICGMEVIAAIWLGRSLLVKRITV